MPYIVQHLIEGRQKPLTVTPDVSVQIALELMADGKYSQLPVIDVEDKPLGIVTSESILRALNIFGVTLDALKVSHALAKVDQFRAEDDLFDLLDEVRDTGVVLIVDGQGKLTGIVTSYDTTDYFRRRAEDMMLVEDIETTIKDHIRAAFLNDDGELDEDALKKVIGEITDSKQDIRKKFQSALNHYVSAKYNGQANFDPNLLDQVFNKHFGGKDTTKAFDDLTLFEYSQLLLYKGKNSHFSSIFNLDFKAIDRLLNEVRRARNALAHFHGELSPKQRDQLRFCVEWFAHHPPRYPKLVVKELNVPETIQIDPVVNDEPLSVDNAANSVITSVQPTEEIIPEEIIPEEVTEPNDSRYAPLALWLKRTRKQNRVELTFSQVEEIIKDSLPKSAREHRNWWANDSVSHPQSQQWLEVGWRVANVSMSDERVIFARIEERERAYIDFFSSLLTELRKEAKFPMRTASPDGVSWITVARLPEAEAGLTAGYLNYSFTRTKQFRVEFYIDTNDQTKNKQIFDALYAHKREIEHNMGEQLPLVWERLDNKRASRIALYCDGSITSSPNEQKLMIRWAVLAMIRLQRVFNKAVIDILNSDARFKGLFSFLPARSLFQS